MSLQLLEDGLRRADPSYAIVNRWSDRVVGDLMYDGEVYAQIEINIPNEDLFGEEVRELKEFAEDAGGRGLKQVLECLRNARLIVVVQVIFGERDSNQTFDRIQLLWQLLLENWDGLLQSDSQGYFNRKMKLVLSVD